MDYSKRNPAGEFTPEQQKVINRIFQPREIPPNFNVFAHLAGQLREMENGHGAAGEIHAVGDCCDDTGGCDSGDTDRAID